VLLLSDRPIVPGESTVMVIADADSLRAASVIVDGKLGFSCRRRRTAAKQADEYSQTLTVECVRGALVSHEPPAVSRMIALGSHVSHNQRSCPDG
jgi:hypothetical protein